MNYPLECKLRMAANFKGQDAKITLFSGLTTFIGPNGSGKTQAMKALRDQLRQTIGIDKIRYLSSNRIGDMEQYRSKTSIYAPDISSFRIGDQQNKQKRHTLETANGDFYSMDEKKDIYIKVAERLSVLFNRQIYIRWDAGYMKVYCEKTGTQEEYSIAIEASGLINIISILAALFDKDIEVLLIDEPEVSLHPQLQAYLLHEIQNAIRKYGKTVIISTHSAEMITINSVNDLSSLVFFSENQIPLQIAPTVPELNNFKLKDFVVRMGQIYKTAFFAKRVLLIEGASDLIICRFLANKLNLNIDAAGCQVIPVDGKGQFPVITKLFRMIGKEVGILTDLDGFIDDNSVVDLFCNLPQATQMANKAGNANLSEMVRSIKTKISELVRTYKTSMKEIYEEHPYWINRVDEEDEEKAIKRAIIAQLFNHNESQLSDWPVSAEWIGLKERLNYLFSVLEFVGCFVLKKGAIESYYLYSPKTTFSGKPSAAADEIGTLASTNNAVINNQYEDVISALRYAALSKVVDESFAVKKELSSELALVLEVLNRVRSKEDIYSAIKQTKGSSNSLFDYNIIHEGERLGVEVFLRSNIIDIVGMPFKIFVGQNVNEVINSNIKPVID